MKRFFLILFVLSATIPAHRACCQSLDSIYGIHLYTPDDDGSREQIREIRNKGITYKAIYQSVIDLSGHVTDSVVLAEYWFVVLPNKLLNEISVRYDSEALTRPDSGRFDTIVYDPYDRYIFSKRHKWSAITNYHDSLGYATRRWIYPDSERVDSFTFNRKGHEIFSNDLGWPGVHTFDSNGEWSGGSFWDPKGRLAGTQIIKTRRFDFGTVETTLLTLLIDTTGKPKKTKQRKIGTNDYKKHQWTISDYVEVSNKWKLQHYILYDSTFRVYFDSARGTVRKTWCDDHDSTVKGELNGEVAYTALRTYDKNGMPLSTLETIPESDGKKIRTDYYYEYGKKK
jgi:hypothetical protein